MKRLHFVTYPDVRGEFRWRLVAPNGKTIADSAEGYLELRKCRAAIKQVKRITSNTPVIMAGDLAKVVLEDSEHPA